MKLEVPSSKRSEEIIKGCEFRYNRTMDCPVIIRRKCYLHIYPKEDTLQDKGNRLGMFDSYLSEIHIFNTDNNTVFVVPRLYDNVSIQVTKPINVRYFKDLSIFVEVTGPVKIILNNDAFLLQEVPEQ